MSSITSFSLLVAIFFFLFSKTSTAVSIALNKRCFVNAEMNTIGTSKIYQMPFSLDDNLPSIVLIFGSSDGNEICFLCHLDSCVEMITGNSLLHIWMMTNYLEIVAFYERYDESDSFHSMTLDCDVPPTAAEKEASKLSAIVTYKICYKEFL